MLCAGLVVTLNSEDKMDRQIVDFKSITVEVVKEISSIPLERPGGFFSRSPVKIKITTGMIHKMLLEKVWGKCIEMLNTEYVEAEHMIAEKAISELIKRGVLTDKVIYKSDSFRLQLENGQYRAYKNSASGVVCACPWPSEKRYDIHISGSRFADFIIQFDAEIPEIVSHVPEIVEFIKGRELEEMKGMMENELKEQILQSLIKQYLEPIGLSATYILKDDDIVAMDISQILSAHLEMPLAQMIEKLKDTDAIEKSLKPVKGSIIP